MAGSRYPPQKVASYFSSKISPKYLYLPVKIINNGETNGFSDEAKFFMRGIIFNGISFMTNYPYIVFGVAFSWINAIYGRGVGQGSASLASIYGPIEGHIKHWAMRNEERFNEGTIYFKGQILLTSSTSSG